MPTTQELIYSDDPLLIAHFPFPIALPPHHTPYNETMATMIAELHAVTDITVLHTYTDPIELSQAMQGLHMRGMLGDDDDGADEEDVNDIMYGTDQP